MSTPSFAIHFDDQPIVDHVAFAVIPMDGFSGEVVSRGVTASIDGLANRPLRNRSGHLVFINLPNRPLYTVNVDASRAGYFSPPPSDVDPSLPNTNRRHVVPLWRAPAFAFDGATTLIRGMVRRSGNWVAGARVWCEIAIQSMGPPPPPPRPFETRTDARGVFALAVRIPANTSPAAGGAPDVFDVTLRLAEGADTRNLVVAVRDGRANVFEAPIDLAGANVPGFVGA
jgi:hypothetical protein